MSKRIISEIIRSGRRTLALEILPDTRLIVRAPRKVSLSLINRIVEEKKDWITRKQEQMRGFSLFRASRNFDHGREFWFLGDKYPLCLTPEHSPGFNFDGNRFFLREDLKPKAGDLFAEWYMSRAREIIVPRVEFYAGVSRLSYSRLKFSGAETRWGSCGCGGTLNFSWRLIMAPMRVVNYVVAHELAHLRERNHSPGFWREVENIFPAYRQSRAWLRKNGHYLVI